MTDKKTATTGSPTSIGNNSALREKIKTIRGINAEAGLRNLNNDVNTYLQILRMLEVNHGGDVHKLISHLADNEIEEAQVLAHNLNGAASMLCLTYLYEAASALEIHLGNPNIEKQSIILEESISKVQRELTEVLADIARIK